MNLQQAQKNLQIWCNNCACFLFRIEEFNDNFSLCRYTTPDDILKQWGELFDYWYSYLDDVEQLGLVEQSREEEDDDYTPNPNHYQTPNDMKYIAEAKMNLEELRDLYTFE